MIAMRPILEPDVLELLNDGRFDGDIEGYVVMDGPNYLGHMLYRIDGDFVDVLDCGLQESALVDGGVRACVAAGENAGCSEFTVNRTPPWRAGTRCFSRTACSLWPSRRCFPAACIKKAAAAGRAARARLQACVRPQGKTQILAYLALSFFCQGSIIFVISVFNHYW